MGGMSLRSNLHGLIQNYSYIQAVNATDMTKPRTSPLNFCLGPSSADGLRLWGLGCVSLL